MNNQMPYGFLPPFNFEGNEINQINKRLDYLENVIKRLEKKVEILEKNNYKPFPNIPNNY